MTCAWEQRKLGEVVERPTRPCCEPRLPRVEYEDIIPGTGELRQKFVTKASDKNGLEFEPGDVLYGKLRPYLMNWLYPQFRGIACGDFWVLRPAGMDGSFLYRLIQSEHFQRNANVSAGSKMPRADWRLVSEDGYMMPLDTAEQRQIGALFSRLDSPIALHQRKEDEVIGWSPQTWEQRKLGDVYRKCTEKMMVLTIQIQLSLSRECPIARRLV